MVVLLRQPTYLPWIIPQHITQSRFIGKRVNDMTQKTKTIKKKYVIGKLKRHKKKVFI